MTATFAEDTQLAIKQLQRSCPACAGLGVLEATDIFCGAGGSSLGLENVRCHACGRSLIVVTQALNHWDLAVEAHNYNFPFADHDVHDVQGIHPKRFRRTPLLWASPGCGYHAFCRGPKESTEEALRSRATFNDIIRWTEYHRYDAVIVENVIEARLWCDDATHGEKCNCGSHFDWWRAQMELLGYESQIVFFNSQFALPTPQSRDRMYVVFWRNGIRAPLLDFAPISWCSTCETVVRGRQVWKQAGKRTVRAQPGKFEWGRYGAQYLYRCPECADPVAPAVTGARTILDFDLPAERIGDRKKPLKPNTYERIRGGLIDLGALKPIVVQVGGHLYERRRGVRVWSVEAPLKTVHGTSDKAVVFRYGGQSPAPRAVGEPMNTITAHDRQIGLCVPAGGQRADAKSLGEPTHTVIGNDRLGVVIQNMANNGARPLEQPTPPVTTGGNHMLVLQKSSNGIGRTEGEPVPAITASSGEHMLVQVNRGSKGKSRDRNVQVLGEPTRTIAGHGELALVSLRNHGSARPLDEPAHTLAASGQHHGLLVYNGSPGFVRSLDDAAGTVTGRDKQSLLVPYYTNGRARGVDEPMGAITTRDREALVVTDADINECLFRMLQWPELLRAQQMHMHGDGREYELTAKRRGPTGRMRELSNEQRVKMIGNAVSSPVATMLGAALVDVLARAA
ncbi:MAG TPA: DNA cytosine methyltransferase [Gaiellaceae bacterium]|nr:DNA cytosine methyltransferase [Gaiellaceae bacterium]